MSKPADNDRGNEERAFLYGRYREVRDEKKESSANHPDRDQQILKLLEQIRERLGQIEKERDDIWEVVNDQGKNLNALEDRSTSTEKTYISLENRLSRTEFTEAPIIERLDKIEREQQTSQKDADQSLREELMDRIEESDLQTARLIERIDEAMAMQSRMTRRIDKLVQDRQKITRKMERFEEVLENTQQALSAKAMVLLTDRSVVEKADAPRVSLFSSSTREEEFLETDLEKSEKALHGEDAAPTVEEDLMDTAHKNTDRTNQKSYGFQVVAASAFVLLAGASGWILSTYMPPSTLQNVPVTSEVAEQVTGGLDSGAGDVQLNIPDPPPLKVNEPVEFYSYEDVQNRQEQLFAEMERNPERVAAALNQIQPTSGSIPAISLMQNAPVSELGESQDTEGEIPIQAEAEEVALSPVKIDPDPSLPREMQKIETAALEGDPEAQHDLAAIYTAGHAGVEQDFTRAAYWFEKAAEQGVANARYNLGVLHHQGLGIQQNLDQALHWYKKAAQLGHPEAQYNLGIAHIEGIGVSYDPDRAAEYFESAAASGILEAAYNLGLIYENGLLGRAQPEEALLWYKTAADEGNEEARQALEELALSMEVEPSDIDALVTQLKMPSSQDTQMDQSVSAQDAAVSQDVANMQQTIADMQKQLIDLGLFPGPADGSLGPLTEDAIRLYQARNNLNVTGQPSENLLVHMLAKNLRLNAMPELGSQE